MAMGAHGRGIGMSRSEVKTQIGRRAAYQALHLIFIQRRHEGLRCWSGYCVTVTLVRGAPDDATGCWTG